MRENETKSEAPKGAPNWSVGCHICNHMSPNGNDGLLSHYKSAHPKSKPARTGKLYEA